MEVKTEDLIRSCGNISCNLNVRLEEALAVAKPHEEPVICKLMTQARALDLSLSQFSEKIRQYRQDSKRRS